MAARVAGLRLGSCSRTRFLLRLLLVLVVVVGNDLVARPAQGYSDNCAGSGLCGQVSKNDCITAYNRFDDGTTYSAYASRVAGHCTAIYRCDGSYQSISGASLKQQFAHIYNSQPCGRCGSHAFNNCEATLNYCGSCSDVG